MPEIEQAIQQLPREEIFRLREVIQHRLDGEWDRKFADDIHDGSPNYLPEATLAEQKCLSHPDENLRHFEPSRESSSPSLHNVEELSSIVIDWAYKLHIEAAPGLLETVYEVTLAKMLELRGLHVRRQVRVSIE